MVTGDGVVVSTVPENVTRMALSSRGVTCTSSICQSRPALRQVFVTFGMLLPNVTTTWRNAGRDWQIDDVQVTPLLDKAIRVTFSGTVLTTTPSPVTMTYTVFGNGQVRVDSTLQPGASN